MSAFSSFVSTDTVDAHFICYHLEPPPADVILSGAKDLQHLCSLAMKGDPSLRSG